MKKVDVAEVLRTKAPAAARYLPGFLTNYLRRIVHEDELNEVLTLYDGLPPAEFARRALAHIDVKYSAVGLDNVPLGGRYIFASNHPFGGADGMMIADLLEARFGDVRVVVNDILMNLYPLKPIFLPVNKHGRQNAEYARCAAEAFDSDIPVLTFPAGLCSRRTRGVVADSEWKDNFIKRAVATRRDVVPVFVEGQLSNFFYRLSNIRKALGIKANIEMLYLADELFRQRGSTFRIIFGEPVPWSSLEAGRNTGKYALMIREKAYNLKK